MDLDEYTRSVAQQLTATAGLADERTQHIAATLAGAAAPAVRLAVLNALSAAAAEITAALLDSPGSPAVTVTLDGEQVQVTVTATTTEQSEPRTDDGDANARISLRLSESLKTDIDAAANRDGISVNTWLVRAAAASLAGTTGSGGAGRNRRGGGNGSHHITGWING